MNPSSPHGANPSFPIGFALLKGAPRDCGECGKGAKLDFGFECACQPVVDLERRSICAHEALVHGPAGESAFGVLEKVNDDNRCRFDQACRVKAIKGAGMGLVRNVDSDRSRRTIVRSLVAVREEMNIAVIAEGVGTAAERNALRDTGIHLMQGYFFARPAFQAMAPVAFGDAGLPH